MGFSTTGLAASIALAMTIAGSGGAAQGAPVKIEYYHPAPSFPAETINADGFVTGFTAPNRWGQYTAYIMATNAKGQRTWRIEHDLPNPDGKTAQGSSIYLLEGHDRALLIDTGNPSKHTDGVDDLKSVVTFLLGHDNSGKTIAHPLDFVVANTHSHGDHIGENGEFADHTIYYMDLDWPDTAPANYVPIREGGGATPHGSGTAVGSIDLGSRKVTAIALPPHTPGSTGYLDVENRMLFSGDALGSGYAWLQWAPIGTYRTAVHHLLDVVKAYPDLKVFGAHFYQYRQGTRALPPINGRPGDLQYIRDEAAAADAILSGKAIGRPYFWRPYSYIAGHGSGQIVYSPGDLYAPGQAPTAAWHAVQLYDDAKDRPASLSGLKADLNLITGAKGETAYLLKGTRAAILVGADTAGLRTFVKPLAGKLPVTVVRPGMKARTIALGKDHAGRAMTAEILPLGDGLSVIEPVNRIALVGDGLGIGTSWTPPGGVAAYRQAVADWDTRTRGEYDILYTGHSIDYYTPPSRVQDVLSAADTAIASGSSTITVPGKTGQ